MAKFDEGGEILDRAEARRQAMLRAQAAASTPKPGLLSRTVDAVKSAADAGIAAGQKTVADWMKPGKSINDVAIEQQTEGKRKGGLVKAKPRGVGIARKGHGRAHHG